MPRCVSPRRGWKGRLHDLQSSGCSQKLHLSMSLPPSRKEESRRRGERPSCYVSPRDAKLTRLLGEESGNLTPQAEVFARLAREYQRAHMAASAPPGIILLDRFVLTILALARVHGLEVDLILPFLREMTVRA